MQFCASKNVGQFAPEKVGQFDWILHVTSHTARRSFATNEYLARDLQLAEIRSITGHKTDKSFYKYIRTTPIENAENVAKKWKERENRKLRMSYSFKS